MWLKNAISTRINVAQRIEFLETAQAIQTAKKNSAEDDFLVMYASHHTAARAHFHAGWLDVCTLCRDVHVNLASNL